MEAKDTVLTQERRETFRLKAQKAVEDYYQVENPNAYPFVPKWLDEHAKQICRDVALEELAEQAEISFKVGIREGIRLTYEDMKKLHYIVDYDLDKAVKYLLNKEVKDDS